MRPIDQRVRHPVLVATMLAGVAYAAWSVYEEGAIAPVLVAIAFAPLGLVAAFVVRILARWPEILDADARRFRAEERRVERLRRVWRHDRVGRLSIAAAPDGAVSVCRPTEDRCGD